MLKLSRGEKSGLPDCSKCDIKELREDWGCDKDSTTWSYPLGSVEVKRCPNALTKKPVVKACWSAYAQYKRGITPNNKGSRFETAFFVEVMAILESFEIEAEQWYNSLMEKKEVKN